MGAFQIQNVEIVDSEEKPKTRKQELFVSCKPDAHYIFEHPNEGYDWDDIVNAFIAGGLYADEHPVHPWKRFDKQGVWMETVYEDEMYTVYNDENGEAAVRSGNEIIHEAFSKPDKWTHYRLFEEP